VYPEQEEQNPGDVKQTDLTKGWQNTSFSLPPLIEGDVMLLSFKPIVELYPKTPTERSPTIELKTEEQ
jgi:hypothetical protein